MKMKLMIVAAATLAAGLWSACQATKTRDLLAPTLLSDWQPVRALAVIGAPSVEGASESIRAIDDALSIGDRPSMRLVVLAPAEAAADAGVDDAVSRGVHAEVGTYLRSRNRMFFDLFRRVAQESPR